MSSLIAYAADFSSFLIEKVGKDASKIRNIILFGSVARGDASENSDVDIFIDLIADDRKLSGSIDRIAENFYDSVRFKKHWKLMGIENKINCIPGRLDKWSDLKRSILSDGIILYGKYKEQTGEGNQYALLSWKPIKPESKRVVFNKKMFGYKQRNKFYKGLLEIYSGEKLDNAVLIPMDHANEVIKAFRSMKITVTIKNIIKL